MSKNKKTETMAQGQKKMYTIFIVVILILFALTSIYTKFNPIVLFQNSDAFIAFITEGESVAGTIFECIGNPGIGNGIYNDSRFACIFCGTVWK